MFCLILLLSFCWSHGLDSIQGQKSVTLPEEALDYILGCRARNFNQNRSTKYGLRGGKRAENFDMIDLDHLKSQLLQQSVSPRMIESIIASINSQARSFENKAPRQGEEERCTQVTVNVPPQKVEGIDAQLQAVIHQNNHQLLEQINTLFRLKFEALQKNIAEIITTTAKEVQPMTATTIAPTAASPLINIGTPPLGSSIVREQAEQVTAPEVVSSIRKPSASEPAEPEAPPQVVPSIRRPSLRRVPNRRPALSQFSRRRPSLHRRKPAVQIAEKEPALEILKKPAPEIVQEEFTPEIVKEESTPEIVKEESTPEIVKEESTPEIVEEESTSEIVKEESTQDVVKGEPIPETLEEASVPLTDEISETNELLNNVEEDVEEDSEHTLPPSDDVIIPVPSREGRPGGFQAPMQTRYEIAQEEGATEDVKISRPRAPRRPNLAANRQRMRDLFQKRQKRVRPGQRP